MSVSEQRRAVIRRVLAEGEVKSQSELREHLLAQGIRVSQPVISRDLRLLRVAKEAGVYRVREEERITPLASLKSLLRSSDSASELVLLRCEPGAASAVARALEAEEIPGVLGTVAGDDTVLVAVASRAAVQRVQRRISNLL